MRAAIASLTVSVLEFVSQLVSSLAWPIVALIAVVFLRSEIKDAAHGLVERIGEIARLKAPGVSIDFKREMKELAQATEELKEDASKSLPAGQTQEVLVPPQIAAQRRTVYEELAYIDPRAAIFVCFADLENAIRIVAAMKYPDDDYFTSHEASFLGIVRQLRKRGQLDNLGFDALHEVIKIRSEVVVLRAMVDTDTAMNFIKSVANVMDYLVSTGFLEVPEKGTDFLGSAGKS